MLLRPSGTLLENLVLFWIFSTFLLWNKLSNIINIENRNATHATQIFTRVLV